MSNEKQNVILDFDGFKSLATVKEKESVVENSLVVISDTENHPKSILIEDEESLEEKITIYERFASLSQQKEEAYGGSIANPSEVQQLYIEHERNADGRKTLLVPHIFLKIVELKELYNLPDSRISQCVGVHYANFQTWKKRGVLPEDHELYSMYFAYLFWCLQKASTSLECECLDKIKAAGDRKWEASRWLLGATYKERYGGLMTSSDGNVDHDKPTVNLNVNLTLSDLKTVSGEMEDFLRVPITIDNEED